MPEVTNNTRGTTIPEEPDHSLDLRIYRVMAASTVLASSVALFVAPWRVSTGLLLGGVLALFSHRWLRNSAAAAINLSVGGGRARLGLLQFVLRYLVVGTIVFLAYTLNVTSLAAVLLGLSTFVVALFVEALREFYFAIIQREEIS
jgi:hypothetical protein